MTQNAMPRYDTNPQSAAIQTRGLTKRFGGESVVRDVSFDVPRGSIFGFIGPSGSGKTTTIRMLTGVYAPSSGQVRVLGSEPQQFTRKLRARIGYMPQHFVLYPNLTVLENLNFAASLYGMSLLRGKQLRSLLDFVELTDARRRLARDTSGGMQRRLSLAATLVHNPELLFLDEPTAGIDPILRKKFWDHFKDLQAKGNTLFITTQYVNEASYCDIIGVMMDGRLLTVDTPNGLRHQAYGGDMVDIVLTTPLKYETETLLSTLPFVKGRVRRTGFTSVRVIVDEASTAIPELVEWAKSQGLDVKSIEEYQPPFDDVFVELVNKNEDKREVTSA